MLKGTTENARPAQIVWSSSGGDIRTYFDGGAYDELWFSDGHAVRRGVSGDIAEHSTEEHIYQSIRMLLTHDFDTLQRINTSSDTHGQYATWVDRSRSRFGTYIRLVYKPPHEIQSATVNGGAFFGNLAFANNIATRWSEENDLSGPQLLFLRQFDGKQADAQPNFPVKPQDQWRRSFGEGELIAATISGHRATIAIDTNARTGLLISPAYAKHLNLPASSQGIVELHDVEIAGARVRHTFARFADDNRYDVRASLALFSNASIVLRHNGSAILTKAPCRDGVPYFTSLENLLIRSGGLRVLLDSLHEGPPVSAPTNALSIALRDNPPCDRSARKFTLGNKTFGSDVLCYDRKLSFIESAGQAPFDMVIGLHTLAADHLLIDTRSRKVCW